MTTSITCTTCMTAPTIRWEDVYKRQVPYEWHILNVKLTATPLANLVVQRMSTEQKEICEILLQTKMCIRDSFKTGSLSKSIFNSH